MRGTESHEINSRKQSSNNVILISKNKKVDNHDIRTTQQRINATMWTEQHLLKAKRPQQQQQLFKAYYYHVNTKRIQYTLLQQFKLAAAKLHKVRKLTATIQLQNPW